MRYTLDTNACIEFLRGRNLTIRTRLQLQPAQDITLNSVALSELAYGASRSANPAVELNRVHNFTSIYQILDFDSRAAMILGTVRADLERRGLPIGPYDMMIAAIALTHNVTLVTHNVREFSRVPGLLIEDWQTP